MARPRKPVTLSLSAHQALYVLEKAVFDRKLTQADVDRYVASMHHEISSIEAKLAHLRDAVVGPVKKLFGGGKPFPLGGRKAEGGGQPFPETKEPAGEPPSPKKRKKRVSAKARASRQLQGQYISALRNLPKSRRAQFQKIAKEEGREKAIAAIKSQ
jgi:hypothetical protein